MLGSSFSVSKTYLSSVNNNRRESAFPFQRLSVPIQWGVLSLSKTIWHTHSWGYVLAAVTFFVFLAAQSSKARRLLSDCLNVRPSVYLSVTLGSDA